MKRKEELEELKGLSLDALLEKDTELGEEKMKLRFRNASGQLEQGHRLKEIRRAHARVKTLISQKLNEKKQGEAKAAA